MAAGINLEELVRLAAKLTADEFAEKHKHPFLIFYENVDAVGASSFATQIVSRDQARQKPTTTLRVMELAKAEGNPYSDRISIGRARNCDVVLRHPSVSKLHSHIRQDEGTGSLVLIDLNSHNGTQVNGLPAPPSQPVPLRLGDQITFGGLLVRVVSAAQLHLVLLGRSPWSAR